MESIRTEERQKKPSRAKYLREWREKKKQERRERRRGGDGDWEEFKEQVRTEAMKVGAPSAVKSIYKEMLKIDRAERKGQGVINADEIARRNIEAERQLREGGYIDKI